MQRKIKTDKKHLATLSHDLNALTSQYDFLMLKSVKGQTGKQTKSHMGQQIEILEHRKHGAAEHHKHLETLKTSLTAEETRLRSEIRSREQSYKTGVAENKRISKESA